jgi:hypothetical protein
MLKVFFQFVLILMPTLVSIFYPLQKIVFGFFALFTIDTQNIEIAINSITSNQTVISIICGILLSGFLYFWRKRVNKEKLFNIGNRYNNYPILIYWIASKILGYQKVTLVRVPIFLQYKLLLADIFPNILVDSDVETKELAVVVTEKNLDQASDELNLILVDTYEISEGQIPLDKLNLPTIIIQNGHDFRGNRFFNPEFIKIIREKTNLYSGAFKQVNIFSTTNTNHNHAIISKCFKNAGRTGFKEVFVYQANRENFNFDDCYKVL